jgi:hypothetical protein
VACEHNVALYSVVVRAHDSKLVYNVIILLSTPNGPRFLSWWEAAPQSTDVSLLQFFRLVCMYSQNRSRSCEEAASSESFRRACEGENSLVTASAYEQKVLRSIGSAFNSDGKFHDEDDMVLAPLRARLGDLVVVSSSLFVPVIIRKKEDWFVCTGECYVQGKMNGEVLEDVESSSWRFFQQRISSSPKNSISMGKNSQSVAICTNTKEEYLITINIFSIFLYNYLRDYT